MMYLKNECFRPSMIWQLFKRNIITINTDAQTNTFTYRHIVFNAMKKMPRMNVLGTIDSTRRNGARTEKTDETMEPCVSNNGSWIQCFYWINLLKIWHYTHRIIAAYIQYIFYIMNMYIGLLYPRALPICWMSGSGGCFRFWNSDTHFWENLVRFWFFCEIHTSFNIWENEKISLKIANIRKNRNLIYFWQGKARILYTKKWECVAEVSPWICLDVVTWNFQ